MLRSQTFNLYIYCANNPLKYKDPTGNWFETLLDVVSVVVSTYEFIKDPGIDTGIALAYDVASVAIPAMPASKSVKWGTEIVGHADEAFELAVKSADEIEAGFKALKNGSDEAYDAFRKVDDYIDGACFTANTLVLAEDGYKKIVDIEEGDYVYAKNENTGNLDLKLVKNKTVKEKNTLVYVETENETIETTKEHPFYVEGRGWIEAIDLNVGDKLITYEGHICYVKQVRIDKLDKAVKVYNFEVEDYHTYFVGKSKILVHNSGCGGQNGVLENTSTGDWKSKEGLIYEMGSAHGNRVKHVLEHTKPDPTKPKHSVFNVGREEVLNLIDEAWSNRGSIKAKKQPNGNEVYNIPMKDAFGNKRIVGTRQETKIRIVVRDGTSKIITSFPVK